MGNWTLKTPIDIKLKIKTCGNKAYSLWRVNGCQQGFRFLASLGFGGQKSASKPPQAICKPSDCAKTHKDL